MNNVLNNWRRALLAIASTAAIIAAATQTASAAATSTENASSADILRITQVGPVVRNFNPWSPTSLTYPGLGHTTGLIYEPLLQFNLLKADDIIPWLATHYAWSDGGRTLTFTIRQGVKWSNGAPFSAADVAFTFNLLKKYPVLNTNDLPITAVSSPNSNTVVLKFSTPAFALLYYVGSVVIVPQSQWASAGNPADFTDPDPIGTGPFTLTSFSSVSEILTKNPSYWQASDVHVSQIDISVVDSNTGSELDLETGNIDWSSNFMPNIEKAFVAKDKKTNHFWQAPSAIAPLVPNLDVFPTNSLAVRQAISDGIDRDLISADGESGQEPPTTGPGSLTGLTLPADKSYLTTSTSNASAIYSVKAAKRVLEQAGWKMGSNGYFVSPSGKPLAFTIEDPSSYTDYIADDQIIASELKKVGMDVTVDGVAVNKWTADMADGNFQATMYWGQSGPTPYFQYNGWLNNKLGAPIGKTARGDYERFSSAQADADLAAFTKASTVAEQKSAMVKIETLVAKMLPVIPVVYRVFWYEYSTARFTGWSTPSHPYAPGILANLTEELIVLHLRPVG